MHEYKKEYTHVKTDITLLQTLTVWIKEKQIKMHHPDCI